jgi:hypothetical protein
MNKQDTKSHVEALLQCTRNKVAYVLQHVCLNPSDRNYGGILHNDNGYASTRGAIYDFQDVFFVYADKRFPEYYCAPRIGELLRAHLDFMRRRQQPDGTIGNEAVGYAMAYEVGFSLLGVCDTYSRYLNTPSDLPGRDEILETFQQYILRGAEAVRNGFAATANHRWTAICAPLAMADSLFPDARNRDVIEDYLSDGIDVNADGLCFEERDPNYTHVANHGLLRLADYWGRIEFLEIIDRTLKFQLEMRQPNGEPESLFSHRQARGAANLPFGDYVIFARMAKETGNGQYATVADEQLAWLLEQEWYPVFSPMAALADDAKYDICGIERVPWQTDVDCFYEQSPFYRFRRRNVATTLAADPGEHFFTITQGTWGGLVRADNLLSYHVENAILDGFKIHWGYGHGGLKPMEIITLDRERRRFRLFYDDPGTDHIAHFRPREKWGPRRFHTNLRGTVDVEIADDGAMTIQIEVGGWEDVPINVQLLLRESCFLKADGGQAAPLAFGGQSFTDGQDYTLGAPDGSELSIRGLPASEHRVFLGDHRIVGGQAERRCHRLIAGVFTPFATTITLNPLPQSHMHVLK